MAERTVSPAVFTNEIDSSFLIQGIGDIGGAIVGPFSKGPAYSPTVIRDVNQLEALFGRPTGTYYQPFTAREYLLSQGVVTIVRTGHLSGWANPQALVIKASLAPESSGSLSSTIAEGDVPTEYVIGVLANTLTERNHDPLTGVPTTLIPVTERAGPAETSIGFTDSYLVDAGGQTYSENQPLTLTKESQSATLVLKQQFESGDSAIGNDDWTPGDLGEFNFTINPNSANSLHNIFGRSAQKNVKPAYFTSYFESSQALIHDLIENHGAIFNITFEINDELLDFTSHNDASTKTGIATNKDDADYTFEAYDGAANGTHACRPATTPWIQSQEISGARYDLFRIHTRSFGASANGEIKVGFYNVRTPGTLDGTDYGSFSVLVRGYDDNDKTQDVIEDFRDVTLDPTSSRYLPRVVGDRFTFIDMNGKINDRGDYANGSNWIRIEMPADSTAPTQCMPYGHASYSSPVGGKDIRLPTPRYAYVSQYSRVPGRYFNGAVFNDDTPDGLLQPSAWEPVNLPTGEDSYELAPNETLRYWSKDFKELSAGLPDENNGVGEGFYMDVDAKCFWQIDDEVHVEDFVSINPNPTSSTEEGIARKQRRFIVGFQGGEDGHSPVLQIQLGEDIRAENVQGMNCKGRKNAGTQAYERAFKSLSNQDEFDINLIVTPGLSLEMHRSVVNLGVDLCETREDAFYILDCVSALGQPGKVDEAVSEAATIDSNYAATYYPWVKIIDPATNALQVYPPSALMPAVYAANDKSAAEWFAPAGLNRGGLEQAISVMDRLTFAERDTLYEGKVNPIAAFPGQGIVAFGQKTLQRRASALDRINVRRLLITLKKFIASTSRYLLFEQNVAATRHKFLGIVNPYLEAVQQRQGLYAFNVVMDESNNTPDLIDRNILYGQIFLQPARAIEYIILDFNVQATGASFS